MVTDVTVWLLVAATNGRASGCQEMRKVRRHIREKGVQMIKGETWF